MQRSPRGIPDSWPIVALDDLTVMRESAAALGRAQRSFVGLPCPRSRRRGSSPCRLGLDAKATDASKREAVGALPFAARRAQGAHKSQRLVQETNGAGVYKRHAGTFNP